MRIIFVRHGDPDYTLDSLTEKGVREAELLSARVEKWPITECFVSPLGRARKTASIALKNRTEKPEVCPWLEECYFQTVTEDGSLSHRAWDWFPEYWTARPVMSDPKNWYKEVPYAGTEGFDRFTAAAEGIDSILARYGYFRSGEGEAGFDRISSRPMYNHRNSDGSLATKATKAYVNADDTTLVFFCHFGVASLTMAHLIGVSPVTLWQSFFMPTTSVTVLAAEERDPGKVAFRCQVLGDTTHLYGKEPVSASGYFTDVFSL